MRRRSFLSALGATGAWPLVARAQQPTPAMHSNSVPECLGAMARIKELAGGDEARICPGHDGEVWTKFPETAPGVYRLA